MKPVLRLVLILLFALVTATGGMVLSDASAEPVTAAAADQPMMAISDCDACAPERMDAGMAGCGFVCAGAPVAIGATPLPCPSSESSAQFHADDWSLSGRARQPEPAPPKQFLS